MEISIETEGLEELLAKFERLGMNSEPILERALERGAKRLQASIKPIVPLGAETPPQSPAFAARASRYLPIEANSRQKGRAPTDFPWGVVQSSVDEDKPAKPAPPIQPLGWHDA